MDTQTKTPPAATNPGEPSPDPRITALRDEIRAVAARAGKQRYGALALGAVSIGILALPMFGHGQVEGFTEKYGMEYYKPRYNEDPNHGLVDRHQREIAPLLRQRRLFAESGGFLLYDLWKENGEGRLAVWSGHCPATAPTAPPAGCARR